MSGKKSNETEFQVRLQNVDTKKVIDFTQKKLERLSKSMKTKAECDACLALLAMYMSGTVAVKWVENAPRYIKIAPKK